jgi:hypothetical protein
MRRCFPAVHDGWLKSEASLRGKALAELLQLLDMASKQYPNILVLKPAD